MYKRQDINYVVVRSGTIFEVTAIGLNVSAEYSEMHAAIFEDLVTINGRIDVFGTGQFKLLGKFS